jgi:hypothetical protein
MILKVIPPLPPTSNETCKIITVSYTLVCTYDVPGVAVRY